MTADRGPGRPTLWTAAFAAEFAATIRDATQRGLPFEASIRRACRLHGVPRSTYYEAKKRAEAGDAELAKALAPIDDAREELQLTLCARVLELSAASVNKGDAVRLAATRWALESLFPADAPSKRLELSGPEGGPIPVDVHVDPADLARRIAALAALGADGAPAGDAGAGAPGDEPGGTGDGPPGD